jgi:hypothetical protein
VIAATATIGTTATTDMAMGMATAAGIVDPWSDPLAA